MNVSQSTEAHANVALPLHGGAGGGVFESCTCTYATLSPALSHQGRGGSRFIANQEDEWRESYVSPITVGVFALMWLAWTIAFLCSLVSLFGEYLFSAMAFAYMFAQHIDLRRRIALNPFDSPMHYWRCFQTLGRVTLIIAAVVNAYAYLSLWQQ